MTSDGLTEMDERFMIKVPSRSKRGDRPQAGPQPFAPAAIFTRSRRKKLMNNRVLILWLAGLTVYVSFTTTDTYRVLKNVESGQYWTMKYMEKSTDILYKLKHSKFLAEEATSGVVKQ